MKIGIAGAGFIVPSFLTAVKQVNDMNVMAICGVDSDREKMEALSKEHCIPHLYYSYDEMLENRSIDTVYIAVPNFLHYHFTKKALQRGKNAFVEKPFASNYEHARELVDLSVEKHLYLFEAIANQYNPNYLKVKETVNEIGDIKLFQMNYSQYSRRYDSFKKGIILPVFDYKKSGGAIMDLNVYNIHFVVGIFGKPKSFHYYANIEKDIDTSGILVMEYATFLSLLVAAKDCKAPSSISIQGDRGYIYSDSPSNVFDRFEIKYNNGNEIDYNLGCGQERLSFELRAFKEMISNQEFDKMQDKLGQSLLVQQILDESRKQAGIEIMRN
ncbi:MAG: Gfo/Idh/MocA family oxidoreductase [Clostridiales bacterium]|jgi:predicted dehydrogenase|nr:Gfo/Idh/MocA family oxidoreductase [Clostridiales bacterium]